MFQMKLKAGVITALAAAFFLVIPGGALTAYAGRTLQVVYYYGDGQEEIEKLNASFETGDTISFQDPQNYVFPGNMTEQDDGTGTGATVKTFTPDPNDTYAAEYADRYADGTVYATGWIQVDEDGKTVSGPYQSGDTFEIPDKSGNLFFRVQTNDTFVNQLATQNEMTGDVYLCYHDAEGNEISAISGSNNPQSQVTIPDPDQYKNSGDGSSESGGVSGNGLYWKVVTEDNKVTYLDGGVHATFPEGYYDLYCVTDDPVTVSFYYPHMEGTDDGREALDENYGKRIMSGQLYNSYTVVPGKDKTITLYDSIGGAFVTEAHGAPRGFSGWECVTTGETYSYDADTATEKSGGGFNNDGKWTPGKTVTVDQNYNDGLKFYALYEYEGSNYDVSAGDQNGLTNSQDIVIDLDKLNSSGVNGVGNTASVDTRTGRVVRRGGRGNIGKVKNYSQLSSLKAGGDPTNPADYTLDKYGMPMEKSKLAHDDITSVLRQDLSALQMDVYGNSMIYYSEMDRQDNINFAVERLNELKGSSWTVNVSQWPEEMLTKYEAIEFALLYGQYPQDEQNLLENVPAELKTSTGNNGQATEQKVIWKDEYLTRKAYNILLNNKRTVWTGGWLNEYTDGLYEKWTLRSQERRNRN